jgi:hypothetical protein
MNPKPKTKATELASKLSKPLFKLITKIAVTKSVQDGFIPSIDATIVEAVADFMTDSLPSICSAKAKTTDADSSCVSVTQPVVLKKEMGILWSNTANVVPETQDFEFSGRLIAKLEVETGKSLSSQELYLLENHEYIGDCYIVYSWSSHRMNYATASVSCVDMDGTLLPPLTITGLQSQYPALATKAGIQRTIKYISAIAA